MGYRVWLLWTMLLVLAACGGLDDSKRDPIVRQKTTEIEALAAELGASLHTNVREVDRPWYGSVLPQPAKAKPFSPLLSRPDALHLQGSEEVTLTELANLVEQSTRLPVHVRTTYSDPENKPLDYIIRERYPMDYRGSLAHVLDMIAARYDIFWDFDGTTITLEPMQTRSWSLPIPVGATEVSQTSAGLGGGSSTVTTSTSHTLDPWASLEGLLRTDLVSPADIRVFREIGQLVVLGRPSDMVRIDRTLEEQLYIYANRIGLEIAVYYVNTANLDQFNLQLTALLRRNSGLAQVSTTGSVVPPAGSVRVFDNQTVPDNQTVGAARDALTLARAEEVNARRLVDNPALRGEDQTEAEILAALTTAEANTAVAEANLNRTRDLAVQAFTPNSFIDFQSLASNEAVVDYRQGSSVTLSGVATPIVLSRISNYVSSISTDDDGRTTLETSTIDEGISIHAIPRLIDRNQLQLSLTVIQNALVSLQRFASGSAALQLPTTDHRAVAADTVLRPGETLILSGYEQDVTTTNKARGFLGTGRTGNSIKVRMVVLVRPALLALPNS